MKYDILNKNKVNFRLIIDGVLVGIITGLLITLFKYIIKHLEEARELLFDFTSKSSYLPFLFVFIMIALALIVGQMVKSEKSIGGSGIAAAKAYVKTPASRHCFKELSYKYIGSIIVLSSGLTAGKVGPSVHFGSMVGIGLGKRRKLGDSYTVHLVLAGIAAGICAIFHAPIAGIIFVLEVITDDASEDVLTVMLSSVAGSLFVVSLFSVEPILNLKKMPFLPFNHYHLVFILILASIIFAKVFNFLLLQSFRIMEKIPLKNEFLPVIPFLFTAVLYFVNREYLGFNLKYLTTRTDYTFLYVLLLYFLVRLVLMLMTFASRVPGGLFYPVIFLGAVTGIIIFNLGSGFLTLNETYIMNFIALGIVAFLTGVYKSPLTATVLILELTANFTHLLPVIFVVLFVQLGTDFLNVEPVHELLIKYSSYFETK